MIKISKIILLTMCLAMLCCTTLASDNETEMAGDFKPIGIGETTSTEVHVPTSKPTGKTNNTGTSDSETSLQQEEPQTTKKGGDKRKKRMTPVEKTLKKV